MEERAKSAGSDGKAESEAPGKGRSDGKKDTPSEKGDPSPNVAPVDAPIHGGSPKKMITIDIPSDGSEVAYCFGDLTPEIVEFVKAICLGIQLEGKESYVFPVEYVVNLEGACQKLGIRFQEISSPPPSPAPKESAAKTNGSNAAAPHTDNPKGPSANPSAGDPAAAHPVETVSGTIKVVEGNKKSRRGAGHYQIVLGEPGTGKGQTFYFYNKNLWPILDQAKGKQAEILVTGKNLIGFKKLGARTFDGDGVTPEIQNSEERKTTGSLFK